MSMVFGSYDQRRASRWYFGGVASSVAALITHPLDLMKVLMQTQVEKFSTVATTKKIVREQGVLALYSGISASMLRQYTYTLTRFAVYNFGSQNMDTSTMSRKAILAGFAGLIGGFAGAPSDLLNVRLQNDVKLPMEKRRNYKHVFDGLIRVCQEEGWQHLFNGAGIAAFRGMLMTVGQIAFYEQSKDFMVGSFNMEPNMNMYVVASLIAAFAGTTMTQPIDVVKTRRMNAQPGEYSGLSEIFIKTAKEGPFAFYKGYVPTLTRIMPQTVLMFLGIEFLRTRFGYLPEPKQVTLPHPYDTPAPILNPDLERWNDD
ncbi:mitochondrial dicarboxylate carrier [Drosophila tropicalis]|uniref:mitochondrial dicarboxylate carrier n=1 Tax=Drosophila tropicalis TaxID=46794 RepID=UPI0035AC0FFF